NYLSYMDINQDFPAIQRLCRLIRFGSIGFIGGVLAIYVLTWCWPDMGRNTHPFMFFTRIAGLPLNAMATLPVADRLLLAAISLPYLAALVWAFYRLGKMLRGFERAEFFERATVGHLRAFAGFLLLAKALSLAAMHLRVLVLVHMRGDMKYSMAVNLSSDDMAVLLMCALFFLIARMMEEGRRLAEENREFI
ncbi:MAG: DUF2975 domain-containing protein, partial [Usitatibacteraceae bacterium]